MISVPYKSEEIEGVLKNLTLMQESVENASSVFLKIGGDGWVKKICEDWEGSFKYFNGSEFVIKRQALLYLANDVIQKSRMRPDLNFAEHMKKYIMNAFKSIAENKEEVLVKVSIQLTTIWKDRKIYSKEIIKEMQKVLTESDGKPGKFIESSEKIDNLPEGLIKIPSEIIIYTDSLRELNKISDKLSDAEIKIKNMINADSISDDDISIHLNDYRKYLELEQKYRMNLLKSEIELMKQLDTDHMQYTHLLKKVTGLAENIERVLDD